MNKDLKIELLKKDVSFKDKEINRLEEELSLEKDKVLELSNHITLYSSEETMLKKINDLQQRIDKAIEYIGNGNLGITRKTREKFIKILKGSEE